MKAKESRLPLQSFFLSLLVWRKVEGGRGAALSTEVYVRTAGVTLKIFVFGPFFVFSLKI